MSKHSGKSERIVAQAFHEVMHNEPSTVKRAKVSEKRKEKMRVAIALNKARKAGADIPKPRPKGSPVFVPEEIRMGYRRIG